MLLGSGLGVGWGGNLKEERSGPVLTLMTPRPTTQIKVCASWSGHKMGSGPYFVLL